MHAIRVETECEGMRIDVFLSKTTGFSRNFFHHLIQRGEVRIDGKTVKKSDRVHAGTEITISDFTRFTHVGIFSEAAFVPLEIVCEEKDYLVLYKPAGVLSHPRSIWDLHTPSVTAFLIHHYSELPTQSHFMRAGLIHRLDKDTQGFLIIAKTEIGLHYFKSLFQQKSESASLEEKEKVPLKKMYRARCEMNASAFAFLQSLDLGAPYIISKVVRAKVPHCIPKLGITKILSYVVVSGYSDLCDMDIEILTGRTHQIRYHLSDMGLPIQGDVLYGTGKFPEIPLQLRAYRLEFLDPYGNYRIFERK